MSDVEFMTPEEEKIPVENWIEDAPTLSDQAHRMYHQTAQVDTKNYDVPNTVGVKHDTGKPMWHLMPPDAQAAIIDVLTYGANKYAPENWRKIEDIPTRYYSAMMRHLHAFRCGETHDPESGLHHLAHAGCCLVFMLQNELERKSRELD